MRISSPPFLAVTLITLALDIWRIYQKEQPANTHEQIRAHRNDAVALSQGPFKGRERFKHEQPIHATVSQFRRASK